MAFGIQQPPHMNKTKQVGVFRNKTTQGTPLGIYIGLNAPPFGLILVGGTSCKKNNNFWGGGKIILEYYMRKTKHKTKMRIGRASWVHYPRHKPPGGIETHSARASHARAQVGVRIAPEGGPKLDGRLNWG